MAGPQKASKNACLSIGSRIPPALRERRTRARLALSPRPYRSPWHNDCAHPPEGARQVVQRKQRQSHLSFLQATRTSIPSGGRVEVLRKGTRGMDARRATKGPRRPVVRGSEPGHQREGSLAAKWAAPDVGRAFSSVTCSASKEIRSEAEQQPQAGPKGERCESSDAAGDRNPRQQHTRQPLLPSNEIKRLKLQACRSRPHPDRSIKEIWPRTGRR